MRGLPAILLLPTRGNDGIIACATPELGSLTKDDGCTENIYDIDSVSEQCPDGIGYNMEYITEDLASTIDIYVEVDPSDGSLKCYPSGIYHSSGFEFDTAELADEGKLLLSANTTWCDNGDGTITGTMVILETVFPDTVLEQNVFMGLQVTLSSDTLMPMSALLYMADAEDISDPAKIEDEIFKEEFLVPEERFSLESFELATCENEEESSDTGEEDTGGDTALTDTWMMAVGTSADRDRLTNVTSLDYGINDYLWRQQYYDVQHEEERTTITFP